MELNLPHYREQAERAELRAFQALRDFMHTEHQTKQEEHIARYTLVCAAVRARDSIRVYEFIKQEADLNRAFLSDAEMLSLARSCNVQLLKEKMPPGPV